MNSIAGRGGHCRDSERWGSGSIDTDTARKGNGAGSILTAGDNVNFRQLPVKWASRLGLQVAEAGDGSLAEELSSQRSFALLVLDVHLRGPSGLELLKRTKEQVPRVEGTILTGNATVENAAEALCLDALDWANFPGQYTKNIRHAGVTFTI